MYDHWEGIYGQSKLKFFFDSLLSGKNFPQAIIINGQKGTGKDCIAARFANLMNFIDSDDGARYASAPFTQFYLKYVYSLPRGKNEESHDDPFEKLSKDTLAEVQEQLKIKNTNPYHRLSITGANEIKINSIRDIHKFLSHTSGTIHHSTVLISDADLMNEEAQNSLLKQIEEPPPHTTFLLTTETSALLRETIRSRCWELTTIPFAAEDIVEILVAYFNIDHEDAVTVAPFSDGSVFQASQLLDKDLKALKNTTIEFLRYALANRINSAFNFLSQNVQKEGAETVQLFLKMILLWFADAQKFKHSGDRLYYNDFTETFSKFHSRYNIESFQPYIKRIELFSTYLRNNNINLNVVFLNLVHLIASITNKDYRGRIPA